MRPKEQGARVIIDALRTGEPRAHALMYDRFAQRLYGYCRVMVADQAADAVRDTLVAAVRLPVGLPDDEALTQRLFGLARAECLRGEPLRRHRDPAAGLLERAFASLRPDQREVLWLTGSGEMEAADVAQLLEVAADTAESLILAAGKRLEQAVYPMLTAERITWTAAYHELVTALGAGKLPRLLAKNDPPLPDDHRIQVLAALDECLPAPAPDETTAVARRRHRGSARPHRVLGAVGVAACVTIALGAYALWPAATGGEPNRLSSLVHASQAHRHTRPGTVTGASHDSATTPEKAVRISPSPSPTTPAPGAPVPAKTNNSAKPLPASHVPATPTAVPTTPSPSVSPTPSVSPSETPSP